MNSKFFLDMDGVVADWRFNAVAVLGYDCFDPSIRYSSQDWDKLRADTRIYLKLPVMPHAHKLVNVARRYRDQLGWELNFLTAIPHNNDIPWVCWDKMLWAQLHFPDIPVHFGPYSEDKQRHCSSPGDILVDDRLSNCSQWQACGGKAFKVGLSLDEIIPQVEADLYSRIK